MLIWFKILIANKPIHFSEIHKVVFSFLLNLLYLPFQLVEYILYRKKIKNHTIKNDPIFIIGHWRSGTTLLQHILTRDKDKGYLNFYETFFPSFFLSTEWFFKPILQKIVGPFHMSIPYMNNIPFTWDLPCEEDTAILNMNSSASTYWAYAFPQNAIKWFEKTMFYYSNNKNLERTWKKHYLHLIKKISIKHKGKQLILKSPPNTARIKQILDIFPNAKFIYIHRNPVDIYYSYFGLWLKTNRSFSVQKTSDELTDKIILYLLKEMTSYYKENKHLIPEKNLYQISYSDLMKDPLKQIKDIYLGLNLNNYQNAVEDFKQCISETKSYNTFKYNYDPVKCAEIEKMMN